MKHILFTIGVLFALPAIQSVQAQQFTTSDTAGWQLSDDWQTFALSKFDLHISSSVNIAPESLVGVTVKVRDYALGSEIGPVGALALRNTGSETLTVTGFSMGFETEAVTSGTGYTNTSQTINPLQTTPDFLNATIAPGVIDGYTVQAGQYFSEISYVVDPSNFSAFLASVQGEKVSFRARAPIGFTAEGSEFEIIQRPTVQTTISVEYTFNLIPEPSTAGLACLAAVGLLIRRRR